MTLNTVTRTMHWTRTPRMTPRYVYWTDVNQSTLERAGLDGLRRTVLISDGVRWPNGLWIDAPARRIYIADAHTNEVFHVNYNGTDRKVGTI